MAERKAQASKRERKVAKRMEPPKPRECERAWSHRSGSWCKFCERMIP